jgi:FKBP-type peptidyl-prolyl cis-trans isomerase FkpA
MAITTFELMKIRIWLLLALLIIANPIMAQQARLVKGKENTTSKVAAPNNTTSNSITSFTQLNNVVAYKLFAKAKAQKRLVQKDDVIFMHLKQMCGDSILNSTYRDLGAPTYSKITQDGRMDDYSTVIFKMGAGDSAIVKFNADSVLRQGKPPFYHEGDDLLVHIKIIRIVEKKELDSLEAEADKQMAEMKKKEEEEKVKYQAYLKTLEPIEDSIILDYAKRNNMKLKKTESGLYYSIIEQGKGSMPVTNEKVQVIYRGTYLNDTAFDVNQNRDKPFSFTLGTGMVIKGWDEGIALLPVGTKAYFLIPSRLAYGDRGYNEVIPANTILKYELELLSITK